MKTLILIVDTWNIMFWNLSCQNSSQLLYLLILRKYDNCHSDSKKQITVSAVTLRKNDLITVSAVTLRKKKSYQSYCSDFKEEQILSQFLQCISVSAMTLWMTAGQWCFEQIMHNPDLDRKWDHYNQNNLPLVGLTDRIC